MMGGPCVHHWLISEPRIVPNTVRQYPGTPYIDYYEVTDWQCRKCGDTRDAVVTPVYGSQSFGRRLYDDDPLRP